jgi:hypothetical protein
LQTSHCHRLPCIEPLPYPRQSSSLQSSKMPQHDKYRFLPGPMHQDQKYLARAGFCGKRIRLSTIPIVHWGRSVHPVSLLYVYGKGARSDNDEGVLGFENTVCRWISSAAVFLEIWEGNWRILIYRGCWKFHLSYREQPMVDDTHTKTSRVAPLLLYRRIHRTKQRQTLRFQDEVWSHLTSTDFNHISNVLFSWHLRCNMPWSCFLGETSSLAKQILYCFYFD